MNLIVVLEAVVISSHSLSERRQNHASFVCVHCNG